MAALRYEDLFKAGEKATNSLVVSTEKELIREYKLSLDAIRNDLAQIYAKYAQGDTLTYAEMTKYNRLASLSDEINSELKKLHSRTSSHLIRLSGDVYEESFFRTAYAIEAGGGPGGMVAVNWGKLAPEVISASVQNPISGLKLSERLEASRAQIVTKIRQEVTQSLIQGESYPKMANRIKDSLDGDATKAMRVARTEGHRVSQEGRSECIDRAEDRGVELQRVWSAALDDRTRDTHGAMDGQVADKDGYFHSPSGGKAQHPGGFGIPEEDINCRCVIRAEVLGFSPKVRRVRGEGEVPYKTYEEWKKARL
jgi:SPP1 gp7 family putative phage head morphogenesis protein